MAGRQVQLFEKDDTVDIIERYLERFNSGDVPLEVNDYHEYHSGERMKKKKIKIDN